ncbi:MAG TPA: hypothetical protein VFU17_08245 [Candidatus Limnocylindrales bacterium]|nr:hypothetical protein [Candidatus Limnocylindrales bacterium]
MQWSPIDLGVHRTFRSDYVDPRRLSDIDRDPRGVGDTGINGYADPHADIYARAKRRW